jgi:hypothetical protein
LKSDKNTGYFTSSTGISEKKIEFDVNSEIFSRAKISFGKKTEKTR